MKRTMVAVEFEPFADFFGCREAAERFVAERIRWIEPGSVSIVEGKFKRRAYY